MAVILQAKNMTKQFCDSQCIINGISLVLEEASFCVMLGPSGSGKTTLLNLMSGLIKVSAGKLLFRDTEITGMTERRLADWKRQHTGNIFQHFLLLGNLTVRENIEIGINPASPALAFDPLCRMLGVHNLLDKFPAQLSGGQQQRVAIARAVIKKPDILFCDEATGSLDEANSKNVVELLHQLNSAFGITILFITHNLQIAETAHRVITIKDGLLCHDRLNEHPISARDMHWE